MSETRWFAMMATTVGLMTGLTVAGDEPARDPSPGAKARMIRFDADQRPSDWGVNFGHWEPQDGVLVVRELQKDKHAAASRLKIPMRDGVIRLKVKFAGAAFFHVGFDPAKGELRKKGHLYSLIVMPNKAMLKLHKDKSDPQSKDKTLATASATMKPGEWIPVELKLNGDKVTAKVGKSIKLEATHESFHVKKPAVVFRVSKGDVHIDDVEITVAK